MLPVGLAGGQVTDARVQDVKRTKDASQAIAKLWWPSLIRGLAALLLSITPLVVVATS